MPHFERLHEYPAFPTLVVYGGVAVDCKWGLTIIDWMASQALIGMASRAAVQMDTPEEWAAMASTAYQLANAMLDERALWVKGPPNAGTLNIT